METDPGNIFTENMALLMYWVSHSCQGAVAWLCEARPELPCVPMVHCRTEPVQRPIWSRYPLCSLWRIPCQRRWMCPEGISYGGRSLREETLWTDHMFPDAFWGGGKGDGNEGMKLSVEEWTSWWKDVCVSQSILILIASKLNESFPSSVCFASDGNWQVISQLYLDLWALLFLFFPPVLLRTWSDREAWQVACNWPRSRCHD